MTSQGLLAYYEHRSRGGRIGRHLPSTETIVHVLVGSSIGAVLVLLAARATGLI